MRLWEYSYLQGSTNSMQAMTDEATRLGAQGWEVIGIAAADKTLGLNSNVLVLKREIEQVPAPPADPSQEWHDDPTGRFDLRRWDGYWTADVATRATKSYAVDPPRV